MEISKPVSLRKLGERVGAVGTDIGVNFYDEDYLAVLNDFETRFDKYHRMSVSDPIIKGLLRAVKNPITGAAWGISYNMKDSELNDQQKSIIEYLEQVIFLDNKFLSEKLIEIMTFVEHGWAVFEKVFTKKKSRKFGDYISVNLEIRLQKSLRWLVFEDKKNLDRVTAINQQTSIHNVVVVDLPIEKLLVFTLEKKGNDITGEGMMRALYKPWTHKDFIERMQMIGIEKMAIGTPLIKTPKNTQEKDLNDIKDQILSYMGNEKGGIFYKEGYEVMIAKGEMNHEAIKEGINQKNSEMAIAFLAQFLLLGQGDRGGAYALGQDQSDFFLNSLEHISKIVIETFRDMIVQLVDFQFGQQEIYPNLFVKGINNKASKELSETLKNFSEAGLIVPDESLTKFIRETYKLPENTDSQEMPDPKQTEKEIEENIEDVNEESVKKKFSETGFNLIKFQEASSQEKEYIRWITRNENFIHDFYNDEYLPQVEQLEENIKKILNDGYGKAKIEKRGGATYLSTIGNAGLKRDMMSKIKDQFAKFEKRFLGPRFAEKIMSGSLKIAEDTIKNIFPIKMAFVSSSELRSFMAGHISNITAFLESEERHILENIESNFGNGLALTIINSQITALKTNRNTLRLSVESHPRAVYRGEILRASQSQNINNFKMLVPFGVRLLPSGATIGKVFLIKNLFQWESENANQQNAGGVVGGLGLHHNSQDYYYPVTDEELEIAQQLSKEQRKKENLAKITQ
jgi:hypothetical protein